MPRPHQAGGTRRRPKQTKTPWRRSATRPRGANRTPSTILKEDLPPLHSQLKAPVAGAAESASAQTQQDLNASSLKELPTTSLEESISDCPQPMPHKTIGSSSSTFSSTYQKLVAGASDFICAPGLQEPDIPYLDEFLVNSSEQKLVEGAVSSSDNLLDTTSYEESNIANPCTVTQNAINGSLRTFPSRSEKFVAGAAESISTLTLQDPDVSSSDEYPDLSSDESIASSTWTMPPTLGPDILVRESWKSFDMFFIRIDRSGSFWVYPNLGGPFQSMDETENAISAFIDLPLCETRIVTTKGDPNSLNSQPWYFLAQAIVDQFNDQNNLFGNLAHELEDLLRKQRFFDNNRWYFHFNFTTKQQECDDDHSTSSKLFFTEVSQVRGSSDWEVNSCCMIEFEAEGGHCFGCKNNGSPDMQHPVETDAYTAGHRNVYLPFGLYWSGSDDDDDDEYRHAHENEFGYEDEDEDLVEVWRLPCHQHE